MKNTAILVILSLTLAFAASEQMSAELKSQARAMDAVDSALDVLKGLKQANIDAQKNADAINRTQEATMKLEIDELTALADSNKEAGDAATAHRKYIAERIDVTNQYLRWIVARIKELKRKRGELAEQRCVSNANFVISLKEHLEGLKVIRMLKAEVIAEVKEQTGITVEGLAQIKDATRKIAGFAHLFNKKAMDEFVQLGNTDPQKVDAEKLQFDEDATDNTRGKIELKKAKYAGAERDVAHRFVDMIKKLEQHIVESIANLEENEIQAAVDLSDWLIHTQAELVHLAEEQKTNIVTIDTLTINIVGAKSREDRLWEIYFESAMTLNDSLAARMKRRAAYMAEKARRLEENLVLDGIIKIFIEQVAILSKKIRAGATDHADDGSFNKSQGDYTKDRVDAAEGSMDKAMSTANAKAAAAP